MRRISTCIRVFEVGIAVAIGTVLLCATPGCSRPADTAPPVASASAALSRVSVAPGSPVDVTYRFARTANSVAPTGDYWVFVHVVDPTGDLLWTDDHRPPTPVPEWRPDAAIAYTRTMFVPRTPFTGEVHLEVGLYSPANGDRLPLSGEHRGLRAYDVATFEIRPAADSAVVAFGDGWHDVEAGGEAGLDWRWSKGEARLSFRNPKRDVALLLELDQPITALGPQTVGIRLGSVSVDTFAVAAGAKRIRRSALGIDTLGTSDTVELTITVQPTFVPAAVPGLRSLDSRELGIRLFNAYVGPQ